MTNGSVRALVLAIWVLALAIALHGGIYQVAGADAGGLRINRYTGAVVLCGGGACVPARWVTR